MTNSHFPLENLVFPKFLDGGCCIKFLKWTKCASISCQRKMCEYFCCPLKLNVINACFKLKARVQKGCMKAGEQVAVDLITFTLSMQVLAEKRFYTNQTNESAGVSVDNAVQRNEWMGFENYKRKKDAFNFNFNFKETETVCCRVLPSAEGLGFVFFTSFEAVTTRLSNLDFGKKTPTSHGLSLISSILEKKKDKLRTLLLLLNEHSNLNIIFNSCLFFFFQIRN